MKTIALILAFIFVGAVLILWLVSPFLAKNPKDNDDEGE